MEMQPKPEMMTALTITRARPRLQTFFSAPDTLRAIALVHAGTTTCILAESIKCCEKPSRMGSRLSSIVTIS
jgi:hypothetical protein